MFNFYYINHEKFSEISMFRRSFTVQKNKLGSLVFIGKRSANATVTRYYIMNGFSDYGGLYVKEK